MANDNGNGGFRRKLRAGYVLVAVNLLTLVLIFVVVNVLIAWGIDLGVYLNAVSKGKPENLISRTYEADLRAVYPGWKPDDIDALLLETWSRTYDYEPFTQFRERPKSGRYVNIDEPGFRRGAGETPWPGPDDGISVFVFGGSTTFGYGVPDSETVPSALQEILADRFPGQAVRVYNFGRGYYYSSQEAVLFLRLLVGGHRPALAVFIDGLNEFSFGSDQPAFTRELRAVFREHSLDDEDAASGLDAFADFLAALPMAALAELLGYRTALEEKSQDPEFLVPGDKEKDYDDPDLLRKILERYAENRKAIRGMARNFGVPVAFVWQPVPLYSYDLAHHRFAGQGFSELTYARYGYPLAREMFTDADRDVIWCADIQKGRTEPLYLDRVHYTAAFSKVFARCIADGLAASGALSARGR